MRSLRPLLANRTLLRAEAAWALAAAGGWTFSIVYALYAYYEHGAGGVAVARVTAVTRVSALAISRRDFVAAGA